MNNVLLVEPDSVLAKTYKQALESANCKVSVVSGAQDAINSADKQKPDLVVLEIQLVGHSGIEFLYEFRSYVEWQKIPTIILSNVPLQEFADNKKLLERELGVTEYLYKPSTSLDELVLKVNQVTAKK